MASVPNQGGVPPGVLLTMDGLGNIFGVTAQSVFEIAVGSSTVKILASAGPSADFGGPPIGSLVVDGNGDLYFAIDQLGPNQDGAICELTSGSTTLTTLFTFDSTTGRLDSGVVSDGAGHLYGTAGTAIFQINEDGSGFATVPVTGFLSVSAVDAAGNLYGVTGFGVTGPSNPAIEKLPHGGSNVTILASFPPNTFGGVSSPLAIDTAGNIYGTYAGNQNNLSGAVFELPAGSSTVNTIATLQPYVAGTPTVGLVAGKDGTIYGVANGGGEYGFGSVYAITPGSSAITPRASFTGAYGPVGQIAMDGNGDIFGATLNGGPSGLGSIYEVPAGSSTIVTLASFDGSNGVEPVSGIVMDRNGNIFGTTVLGGTLGDGTIFELAAGSSTPTVLASFDGTDGANPNGQIAIDANGNLYGTTATGGANRFGDRG
ncbi:MAG TPA: choice-of-anchor tandem repeat GloVer-containing protein [Tepidisphaeraceae bacterium]|nr:choice-of-anchor tandem repeat GloVer-containing protein [Tepidisphaeraceae bacterium]